MTWLEKLLRAVRRAQQVQAVLEGACPVCGCTRIEHLSASFQRPTKDPSTVRTSSPPHEVQ